MRDYEVVASLQQEALRDLEAKAESLRTHIKREGGDPGAESRLELIERILGRIYEQSPKAP